jgi:hypothetical protein
LEDFAVTTPDWLARHGGELRPGPLRAAWYVYFDGEPQYALTPIPVGGKHSCCVTQTINGKRLDTASAHETEAEAIHSGLEDLRKALGW